MTFAVEQKGGNMSDYISRDGLAEHKFPKIELLGMGEGQAYRQGWNDAIDAIIDNEPAADVVEQKWIPVSEGLPDSRRDVLITVSNGKDYETYEAYYHELRKDWFELNGDSVCEMTPSWKVIAWHELPEPYKGEQE